MVSNTAVFLVISISFNFIFVIFVIARYKLWCVGNIRTIVKKMCQKVLCIIDPSRKQFTDIPNIISYKKNGNYTCTHLSAYTMGNVGDGVLPINLRDLFNQSIGVKIWHGYSVRKEHNINDIERYNKDDFIVIGGGGLFLKDSGANNNSGWQWNCSIDNLLKIQKPIIGFALGYNRFRNQDEFEPIFTEHINQFVSKAIFVGLRNHGSINAIQSYLQNEELKQKVCYQPCMTTLISKLYPNLYRYDRKENFIALNCAFDRKQLRSLNCDILCSIAKVAKEMTKFSMIKFFVHAESDTQILPYLDKYGVDYEIVRFLTPKSVLEAYSKARMVIGMRGHAQMIPFGCNTPIVSIISHDKMAWFLDDIHHPEWGVDVLDANFEAKLLATAKNVYNSYEQIMKDLIDEQNKLWNITLCNMDCIKKKLNGVEKYGYSFYPSSWR